MELRELAHAITLDVLAVGNAIFFILVALALIRRLFIILFFVIAALVEQRRVGVVQYVLRVGAHFAECVDEALGGLVHLGIGVVKHVVLPAHI